MFTPGGTRPERASCIRGTGKRSFSIPIGFVRQQQASWLPTAFQTCRRFKIDLLPDRIERAGAISPEIDFKTASGYSIPYPESSMNLVSAFTVFSSILDPSAREALAAEALRVLKPEGWVLVYDYRLSDPRNPDTIGIRKREVRRIFPGLNFIRRTLTLAPPISRRIAPLSTLLAHGLEVCYPFLRTHAFYLVGPKA